MERMPQRTEDLASRLRRTVVAVAAATAFVVGACASPGGGATTAPTTQNATTGPASDAPGTPAGESLALAVAQDPELGAYVTGENGMALYIFTPDTTEASNCNDACAAAWPPLTAVMSDDVTAGTGVTGAIGTITRADGSMQVTLGGHPLYYFANDQAAGDVNGQGLNDVWYLAGPDGSGVGMDAAPAPEKTPCAPSDRTCY